ncbi:MAG: hypothetical protein FVQ83_08900 [Chloroflexi bacterium]|nr:hypothetical protein [Chloroflexota bacterium]
MSAEILNSYLNETTLPYPFCPGCGHSMVLNQLDAVLVDLQIDPHKLVIVTDIGCVGLSDKFFDTNAFHGLHGRSMTYATGIKLANPELKVIVLIGDGGCTIGGNHLISAARRNIGISVLVFNNLNFGMTGGEHSVTTPTGAITATTNYGHIERPLDICGTISVNGAGYVARSTVFEKNLPELITEAIAYDGFSLLDIWELCTAYYAPKNQLNKKSLERTLASLNFSTGVLHQEIRPEYSHAYRTVVTEQEEEALEPEKTSQEQFGSNLSKEVDFIIAGEAGKKIVSGAAAFSQGALKSGLWATQRNDHPVTVQSGYSVTELKLSPEEILFTGTTRPDVIIVLFDEGLKKVSPQINELCEDDTLYINSDLLPVETRAKVISLDFTKAGKWSGKKRLWCVMALAELLRNTNYYPLEAFQAAVSEQKRFAEDNLTAIEASEGLISFS